ncbi:hypothetical protein IU479_30690 [Nocardia abscessus]|uniref:WXG100 family type VII secretion target n=1 Tax=Nocardia abscessus TaxID=120957 RepID=UPI00189305C4|nr:WXG100 family type VII secretion target [Nocardia abscessus]MBF6222465.1 hypothetical protein [Nocardia abscessus]
MPIELPSEVVFLLNVCGVPYPDINEDDVRALAQHVRTFSSNVQDTHESATGVIHDVSSVYSGESYEQLVAAWARMSATHMAELGRACAVVATALDVAADVIEIVKIAVLAELAALAASYLAIMATPAGPATTPLISAAAKRVCGQMEQALMGYFVAEVLERAIEPLGYTIDKMINGAIYSAVSDTLGVTSPGSTPPALFIDPDEVRRYADILSSHADDIMDHAATFAENVARLDFTTGDPRGEVQDPRNPHVPPREAPIGPREDSINPDPTPASEQLQHVPSTVASTPGPREVAWAPDRPNDTAPEAFHRTGPTDPLDTVETAGGGMSSAPGTVHEGLSAGDVNGARRGTGPDVPTSADSRNAETESRAEHFHSARTEHPPGEDAIRGSGIPSGSDRSAGSSAGFGSASDFRSAPPPNPTADPIPPKGERHHGDNSLPQVRSTATPITQTPWMRARKAPTVHSRPVTTTAAQAQAPDHDHLQTPWSRTRSTGVPGSRIFAPGARPPDALPDRARAGENRDKNNSKNETRPSSEASEIITSANAADRNGSTSEAGTADYRPAEATRPDKSPPPL